MVNSVKYALCNNYTLYEHIVNKFTKKSSGQLLEIPTYYKKNLPVIY